MNRGAFPPVIQIPPRMGHASYKPVFNLSHIRDHYLKGAIGYLVSGS